MEIDPSGGGPQMPTAADAVVMQRDRVAGATSVAVLKKELDLQNNLVTQLYQSMGIGQNLDVRA